jgi:hypothetical protein
MSTNFQGDDLSNYVQVSERMAAFWKEHPNGRVIPTVIEHNLKKGFILIRSELFDERTDTVPAAVGHASEYREQGEVNWTSYVENCETSANGRALANRGYLVDRGIASREEMLKVQRHQAGDREQVTGNRAQPSRNAPPPVQARTWDEKNGKLILVLGDGEPEPNEAECPIHHQRMKRRENNNGSWLSHKDEQSQSGYCSAGFGRLPRPQVQAADLKAALAAHNQNGRAN